MPTDVDELLTGKAPAGSQKFYNDPRIPRLSRLHASSAGASSQDTGDPPRSAAGTVRSLPEMDKTPANGKNPVAAGRILRIERPTPPTFHGSVVVPVSKETGSLRSSFLPAPQSPMIKRPNILLSSPTTGAGAYAAGWPGSINDIVHSHRVREGICFAGPPQLTPCRAPLSVNILRAGAILLEPFGRKLPGFH